MTIRIMKTLGVILAGALLLAACGTKKAPTYNGGGYSSPTTTTTSPSLPIGSPNSPTWVAAKFASINWSSSPKWPSQNYIYTLERPYLTPAMNAANTTQAERPVPQAIAAKWDSDVCYGIGKFANVSQAWVVTDAGVTPTERVVELDLTIGTTQDGVESATEGSTYEYAFLMEEVHGKWFVASPPEEPQ